MDAKAVRSFLFFAIGFLTFVRSGFPQIGTYYVIVHPQNPSTSVERKFLEDAFLKKVTRWQNGEAIRPVDATTDSEIRQRFSKDVLRRSAAAVKSYWQQQIFGGRDVPPPELASEEAIVNYVIKYPGAVGYVSSNVKLEGTKIISVK